MSFGTVSVTGENPVATLLVSAGDGPVQVVNNDSNNTLYLGDNVSIAVTDVNVTPLGPLTPVTFDGTEDVYGIAIPGQTVQVLLFPSATGWTPSASQIINTLTLSTLPVLIAQAVQSAGVPPIDIPAITHVNINSDVPPAGGGVYASGHISMSKYQSYSCVLHADNTHNNADTIPYMRVTFAWSLQADNYDPVHVEDWVIPVTPFSFFINYHNYGAGPCYSDTLDITVTSYDTVINTVTIGVFGSFRQRLRTVFRGQYNFQNISGAPVIEAKGLGTDAILASISGTNLAAGASTTPQLVNLWHGTTSLYLTSEDAAVDDLECHIQPQPASALPNQSDIVLTPDGGGLSTVLNGILLPRRVCTMFFVNQGIITIPSFSASLVMDGVSE